MTDANIAMRMMRKKAEKGFTIVELVLVMGIVVILAVIGTLSLRNFRDFQELDSGVRELVVHLRDAQQRAITQEDASPWGIFFMDSAEGDYYDLFKGVSYVSAIEHVALESFLEFVSPLETTIVRFERISGKSVDGDGTPVRVTIGIKRKGANCVSDPSRCKNVVIEENGVINRQ